MKLMNLLASLFLILSAAAWGYVPTVESLFRNATNPDVTSNALYLNLKISPATVLESESKTTETLSVRLIYNHQAEGPLKLTELLFNGADLREGALADKVFLANLTPLTFQRSPQDIERGVIFSVFMSALFNDGSFLVEFLKNQGINVHLNEELLNKEKRQLLARYKTYLAEVRTKKNAENPLAPTNPSEKERVDNIMKMPMYANTEQVSLSRFEGEPAWHIKAAAFEAWVSDSDRSLRKVIFRSGTDGEIEINLRDYWLANGTHRFPRLMIVKTFNDQLWQIESTNLRHFNETSTELVTRLKRYDKIMVNRPQTTVVKPSFLF